jgi:hypothetical protein
MSFRVGDSVSVLARDSVRQGQIAQVLPNRHSVPDFQEYVVRFPNEQSRRLHLCLCREFELRRISQEEKS